MAEADCGTDLSQVSPGRLAPRRVHHSPRATGRRRNRDHETGRARYPVVEPVLGPRDPQARRQRESDFDPDHKLSGADDHPGTIVIRPMVSGNLLPPYAGTLRFGPLD